MNHSQIIYYTLNIMIIIKHEKNIGRQFSPRFCLNANSKLKEK